ncbi:MAG TPA: N-acetylmuramoyl-L-alanine amidase [Bryobacteraceae bacterium]|nr:N-acetylmuramoyl-L-alanine amidase [Bryobacteraceae bacterium]
MRRSSQPRTVLAGWLVLGSYCFGAPPPTTPSNTAVTAVRYWTLNEATRVVIETTGEFDFTSDRAYEPDRIFFDVKGAKLRLGSKGMHSVPVGDRLLKQIRIAEVQPGVTRVVFDLDAAVEFSASQLTNPSRLIVELRPGVADLRRISTAEVPASIPAKATTTTSASIGTPTQMPAAVAKLPPPPALPKTTVKVEDIKPPLKPPRAAALPKSGQSMTRVLGLKIGRVVLDAGHGGHDTGTIGPSGLYEKELVLDVTKRLGALIESRMGAEVVYTRSDDTYIGLETRTRTANEHRADLFLSIHANSSPANDSSGVETYYLNFTTSKEAMAVAARENASSHSTVYELKDLLQKIALQDKVQESKEFAQKVQQALYGASARALGKTKNRGVKKAPFVVLIGASMPSVLAEIGFVSNPKDEALLRKPDVRQKIAEGLYKGLAQYAGTLSQFQVAKN